jgi:hypothetical protein
VAPLPRGVAAGFHRVSLPALVVEHIPALNGFAAWSDSTHVLYIPEEQRIARLVSAEIGGSERELQTTDLPWGFGEISVHGERMTYVRHPSSDRSRVASSKLDGRELVEHGDEADFAGLQSPAYSPDGRHIAISQVTYLSPSEQRRAVTVFAAAEPTKKVLRECATRCSHVWDSTTTLLVLDGRELGRVDLDGSYVTLENDVVDVAVAGVNR